MTPDDSDLKIRDLVVDSLNALYPKQENEDEEIKDRKKTNWEKIFFEIKLISGRKIPKSDRNNIKSNLTREKCANQHYMTILFWLCIPHDDLHAKREEKDEFQHVRDDELDFRKKCNQEAKKIIGDIWSDGIVSAYEKKFGFFETSPKPEKSRHLQDEPTVSPNLADSAQHPLTFPDVVPPNLYDEIRDNKPNTDLYKLKKRRFDNIIQVQLTEYEPNPVEENFCDYVQGNESGYWLLTAGPGMGKTALMARLYSLFEGDTPCIAYFFQYAAHQEFQGTLQSYPSDELRIFYNFLLERLSDLYNINIDSPYTEHEALLLFEKTIYSLSQNGRISKSNPLIIFVDALDEYALFEDSSTSKINPLRLPEALPSGVFFALSRRPETFDKIPNNHAAHAHQAHVWIDGHSDGHRQTARRYVRRVSSTHKLIRSVASRDFTGPPEQKLEQFVEIICNKASFNFMYLRCLIHDKTIWELENPLENIPKNLSLYYDQHILRMTTAGHGAFDAKATYCFALFTEISRTAFFRLLGATVSDEKRRFAQLALEQWLAQGLITKRPQGSLDWLSPYHRTYREFIEKKFLEFDSCIYLKPLISNFTEGVNLSGSFDHLRDEQDEIRQEWFQLTIRMSCWAQMANTLSTLICNLTLWNIAAKLDGGISRIVEEIGRFPDSRPPNRDWSLALERLADNLMAWCKEKKLLKEDETPYTISEITAIAGHANPGKITSRSDKLMNVLNVRQQTTNEYKEDKFYLIESLFVKERIARGEGDVDLALNILNKIEKEMLQIPEKEIFKNWSRYHYERGYIFNIIGDYQKAAIAFENSGSYGKRAGDFVRGLTGDYRVIIVRFYNKEIDATSAFRSFVRISNEWDKIKNVFDETKNVLVRQDYSFIIYKSIIAFEANAPDFIPLAKTALSREYLLSSRIDPEPTFEMDRWRLVARLCALEGDFEKSIANFSAFLDVDWPDSSFGFNEKLVRKTREFAHSVASEHVAQDYRDLGRSIMMSSRSSKEALATACWKRGLELGPGLGNLRFLEDIKSELAKL